MVHTDRPSNKLLATVAAEAHEVDAILAGLGQADGEYLFHVVQTLLQPRAYIYAETALLVARAIAGVVPRSVIRFAAAVEIIAVASLAHRETADTDRKSLSEPAIDGHLVVLAGDYLYAQAAYITAGLHNLDVMASLASAIKAQCTREVSRKRGQPSLYSGGLYTLSAIGTGQILLAGETMMRQLRYHGQRLDANTTAPSVERATHLVQDSSIVRSMHVLVFEKLEDMAADLRHRAGSSSNQVFPCEEAAP